MGKCDNKVNVSESDQMSLSHNPLKSQNDFGVHFINFLEKSDIFLIETSRDL